MQLKSSSITVSTNRLREKLNHAYQVIRSSQAQPRHFDELWDLKELALMTAQESIVVPQSWMEDIERHCEIKMH